MRVRIPRFCLLGSLLFLLFFGLRSAVAEEMVVARGEEDYPPYEMTVDGVLMGFHVDVVQAVARQMGLSVRWVSVPWKRALVMLEQGDVDAVTYVSRNLERECYAIFLDGNYLSSAKIHFVVQKKNEALYPFDGDLDTFLYGKELLKLRGFSFECVSVDRAPAYEVSTMPQMLQMLVMDRYEVAVVNWGEFVRAMKGRSGLSEVMALQPPVSESRNYIAFSKAKKNEGLAKRFEEAYAVFKRTSDYEALVKKYEIVQ